MSDDLLRRIEAAIAVGSGRSPTKPDPRDPDHSRPAPFNYHNCWKCRDGQRPCVNGDAHGCEHLHARND